jgi:ABC-type transport system involved in cytochrome c biogenesis ATPase subunit
MNTLKEITDWVMGLPYWEQLAFDRIVSGGALQDGDYEELLHYLLEDNGLAQPRSPRPTLRFPKLTEEGGHEAIPPRLLAIEKLRSVNALAPDQRLEFGPQITAIYGANGAGKSGYVRVLASAGFTRGDRDVLPDVTQNSVAAGPSLATIVIDDADGQHEIEYKVGEPCADLASVQVFDSTSVRVHLTGKNNLAFSPAQLELLTDLARVTDEVRLRLKQQIMARSLPHHFSLLFQGTSRVSDLVAGLGEGTDEQALLALANLTSCDVEHISELDLEIARLKTMDVTQQRSELVRRKADLERLVTNLKAISQGLADGVLGLVSQCIRDSRECEKAIEALSTARFQIAGLSLVGSARWRRFVDAAAELADAESEASRGVYPQPDSVCLLCHQPLSAEAQHHLISLWAYLKSDAQERLTRSHQSMADLRERVESLNLDVFSERFLAYGYLEQKHPEVKDRVVLWLSAARARRDAVTNSIDGSDPALPVPSLSGVHELLPDSIIEEVSREISALAGDDPTPQVNALIAELLELQHRQVLSNHIDEILQYVHRAKWAAKARAIGGNTKHITAKYNQLFNALVTQQYVELFKEKLSALERPLRVRVQTIGKKGQAIKQLVVDVGAAPGGKVPSLDKVLSEGEKRAVALADFLTEVELDPGSGCIVLDDPVTSLDLEWRILVAALLGQQAMVRQVVIFTHDLPFLYHLVDYCTHNAVEIRTHWVQRQNDAPGHVFLDNSPALESDYRKATRARDLYAACKDLGGEEQERLLREGFAALRTCYEALIIFELLNAVVIRFSERISVGRLREIAWDEQIIESVVEKHELLSRLMEGHLHSDPMSAPRPTPKTLLSEIECFDGLRKQVTQAKKRKKAPNS